jgi:hypothetical protein
MIKVFFGRTKKAIINPDTTFKYGREDEWFADDLVKQMIKDIDGCDVLSPRCIDSPIFGQIPPDDLSGGVKALILMLKSDYEMDLIACGENCAKWVVEISKIKDITVSMSSYDLFIDDFEFEALCLNDGSMIHNSDEWWSKSVDYLW